MYITEDLKWDTSAKNRHCPTFLLWILMVTQKQQKLIKMAKWLSMDRQYANRIFQIDVIAIALSNPPIIDHLKNVILDYRN